VGIFALTAALATPRLEVKRTPVRTRGFIQAPTGSTIAGIGIGNGAKFAYSNSWTTSDGLPDDFTTDFIFYTDENISSVFGVYSLTDKNTTVTIQVKSATGQTVYSDSFSGAPTADIINFIVWPIGPLPAGNYKFLLKAKQGATSVGGSYWVTVSEPPTP
jgi:hypothetical protein